MSRDLNELMSDLENGVNRIKNMANELESNDLCNLSRILQRIIEFSAELARLIDDCEIMQKEYQVKQAVSLLLDSGFNFQHIEIDGMRFDTEKNHFYTYNPEDDIRR